MWRISFKFCQLLTNNNLFNGISQWKDLLMADFQIDSHVMIKSIHFWIRIGPVFTSLGYETSKFSFDAPAEIDTVSSYFGSGSGPALFFDISKIIKN